MMPRQKIRLGRTVAALVAVLFIAAVAACQSTPTPKTPAQTAYAVSAMYQVTANLAADLTRQGTLSVEQAKEVQQTLRGIRPAIETSIGMARAGEEIPADRIERLRKIQGQLMDLQRRLEQRKQEAQP